ncbi:hypothetical protein AB0886_17440 [Streptomyces sp. NPDC024062]|uniref:hypothetical protein n=1 Tax=unclassified Streptomyces TaxID=2593676 RepID=UPI00341DF06C
MRRTVEAFRQFGDGQLPAGPGADALMAAFRTAKDELQGHEPGPAKVVTDRQVELLLKKKAAVLHFSAANYSVRGPGQSRVSQAGRRQVSGCSADGTV